MASSLKSTSSVVRADVQWWDWSSIYVHCPTCDEIHIHHFDGLPGHYERPMRRLSDCDTTGRYQDYFYYQVTFPFDAKLGEVNYEIDKQRALFVRGTADPSEYYWAREGDDSGLTSEDFKDRRKWTEATEMAHYSEADTGLPGGFSTERIDLVVSALSTGNVGEVRRYLESSRDAEIFLHGVEAYRTPHFHRDSHLSIDGDDSICGDGSVDGDDSVDGNDLLSGKTIESIEVAGQTALHLAACEKSSEMVELLLVKGANPNVVNMRGRSPLMEAALWGRIDNVKLLLKHGADRDIHCVRRGKRVRAADFARSLDKSNREERHSRSGGVYKEDTVERDRDLKRIFRLLSGGPEEPPPARLTLSSFAFSRSMEDRTLLTLIANFGIPNEWKTVAILHRNGRFPPVAAMSGWSHNDDTGVQVGGREWTAEVFRLCNFIRYPLPNHERDNGIPGQYHACHAEKQLVAVFVNKHLFLADKVEVDNKDKEVDDIKEDDDVKEVDEAEEGIPDVSALGLSELPDDEEEDEQWELGRRHREKLTKLLKFEPPVTLKRATILVCRPVCEDCRRFVEHVNSFLGLELTVFHR